MKASQIIDPMSAKKRKNQKDKKKTLAGADSKQGAAQPNESLTRTIELSAQYQAMAMYKLGLMYLHGEGVPESYTVSMQWLEAGAEAGNAESAYCFATLLEQGEDATEAYNNKHGDDLTSLGGDVVGGINNNNNNNNNNNAGQNRAVNNEDRDMSVGLKRGVSTVGLVNSRKESMANVLLGPKKGLLDEADPSRKENAKKDALKKSTGASSRDLGHTLGINNSGAGLHEHEETEEDESEARLPIALKWYIQAGEKGHAMAQHRAAILYGMVSVYMCVCVCVACVCVSV